MLKITLEIPAKFDAEDISEDYIRNRIIEDVNFLAELLEGKFNVTVTKTEEEFAFTA